MKGIIGRLASLRLQVFAIVVVAVLPLASLLVYDAMDHLRSERERMQPELLELADQATREIEERVAAAHNLARLLAESAQTHAAPAEQCARLLAAIAAAARRYDALAVTSAGGEILCRSPGADLDFARGDWLTRGIASGQPTMGAPAVGRLTGRVTLPIAWPVRDVAGGTARVIIVGIDLTDLTQPAIHAVEHGLAAFAWDGEGRVLAGRSGHRGGFARRPVPPALLRAAGERGQGIVEAPGFDGRPHFFAFARPTVTGEAGLTFAFGIPVAEAHEHAAPALWQRLAAALLIGGAMLALAWRFAEVSLRRPLARLTEAFERLGRGELGARLDEPMPRGELERLRGAFNDTTAALEQQAASVVRNEKKYRQLIEAIEDFVYSGEVGPDPLLSPMLFVSPQVHAVTGRTAQEFLADPALWSELLHPEDRAEVLAQTEHCLLHGGRTLLQYRLRHASSGEYRWIEDQLTTERGADGRVSHFFGVARDISRRKLAEERLRALGEDLERRVAERTAQLELANRAKDSFLAAMSHEMRTPLAGMVGMLEVLALSPLDRPSRETLDMAMASARSLVRIVDDILDWSKLEAGELELAPRPTLVRALVSRVANTYARAASARGLTLRQNVDPAVSPALVVDPLRLAQVLGNLVSNAIKFTPKGEVEIGLDLVERTGDRESVRFWVRDTGVGMDAAARERILAPPPHGIAYTSRRYGGTGLGLAICRNLAALMKGQIEVRSAPGEGSVFSLTLDLERAARLPEAEAEAADRVAPLSTAGTRAPSVLVVDDHPTNRELLARQLGLLGLRFETEESASMALRRWQDRRHDLVLTDCHMPDMDGFQLARAIREVEAREGRGRVPIVAWTASAMQEEAERCREAGMDEVLVKPTPLAQLRAVLARWLPAAAPASPAAAPAPAADSPIDASALAELTQGDEDLEREILERFRLANDEDAALVHGAAGSRDLAALRHAAHRMKGAARTVGATALAAAAECVEQAARRDDLAAAQDGMRALDAELSRLDAWLGKAAGSRQAARA